MAVAIIWMAPLGYSPLTATAGVTGLIQAVEDAVDGGGEVITSADGTVDNTVESGTDAVTSTVEDATETVTQTVDKASDETTNTVESGADAVTGTVDNATETVTQTVDKASDEASNTVESGADAVTSTVEGTTETATETVGNTATKSVDAGKNTVGHEGSAELSQHPGDNYQTSHSSDDQPSTSGTAAQQAAASSSDDRGEAGDSPVRLATSVGPFSLTRDPGAAYRAAVASNAPDRLFATVRIRDEGEPFVAAVEIDTTGRELLVHLEPVDRPPLPDPDDDRGATSRFEATVAVASEEPFRATVRFVVRDDGLVLLVDPTETLRAGVTEVLSEFFGRLAFTGLHVFAVVGVGVALVTAGAALTTSTNRRRRRLAQTLAQAGQSAALSHEHCGASPRHRTAAERSSTTSATPGRDRQRVGAANP